MTNLLKYLKTNTHFYKKNSKCGITFTEVHAREMAHCCASWKNWQLCSRVTVGCLLSVRLSNCATQQLIQVCPGSAPKQRSESTQTVGAYGHGHESVVLSVCVINRLVTHEAGKKRQGVSADLKIQDCFMFAKKKTTTFDGLSEQIRTVLGYMVHVKIKMLRLYCWKKKWLQTFSEAGIKSLTDLCRLRAEVYYFGDGFRWDK